MEYTQVGSTGLHVSRICMGTMSFGKPTRKRPWALGLEEARPLFRAALDSGINFFDTANVYGEGTSEQVTGAALRELASREDYVIATKVSNRMRPGPNGAGLSRKIIHHEIDASLKRLGTDYVDLYQIHRLDPNTPFEETMEALHEVVKAGKARYIGASSMFAWQLLKYQRAAERNGWTRFVSMQNHVNLIYREEEREMLPLCQHDGIGVIPWSPLAGGKLARPWSVQTDRSRADWFNTDMYVETVESDRGVISEVQGIATNRGVGMAEVALAWLLQKEGVTAPIVGVRSGAHVEAAARAVDLRLSDDEVQALEAPYRVRSVAGF